MIVSLYSVVGRSHIERKDVLRTDVNGVENVWSAQPSAVTICRNYGHGVPHTGLIIGPIYGGRACVQHYVLRIMLWRNGSAPLNYVRFLDYAAERIFLRKVGGGYIFVHRLLLEYFASLEPEEEGG